jgi:hypothetical protein
LVSPILPGESGFGGGEVMGGILGKVRRKPDSKAGWGKLRLMSKQTNVGGCGDESHAPFSLYFPGKKTNQSNQTS